MSPNSGSSTSLTLLGRLRYQPSDQEAWSTFVDRYGPKIYAWCRGWGVQDADARDVVQDVLLKLATKLAAFRYDPTRSFRGWLRTLTLHAWSDLYAGRTRAVPGTNQAAAQLAGIEARDDLVRRLQEEFDLELLDQAIARVRRRVSERSWEAFRLTAQEGLSGAEAAGRLQMKVAAVFVAKSEVRRMLREEVQALDGGG